MPEVGRAVRNWRAGQAWKLHKEAEARGDALEAARQYAQVQIAQAHIEAARNMQRGRLAARKAEAAERDQKQAAVGREEVERALRVEAQAERDEIAAKFGRPPKGGPVAARPVYIDALARLDGRVDAAVHEVMSQFKVTDRTVYRWKKLGRWPGSN
jgi:hypothetical protein